MAVACVAQAVPARAEPVTGPESGTVYDPVYTCASGHLTVRYSPPPVDQRVYFSIDFSDDDGVGWSWLFNFNRPDGSAGASAVWASPPIKSWTIAEGLTEKGPRSLVSDGAAWCPDYATLPATTFTSMSPRRILDTRPSSLVGYLGPKPGRGSTLGVDVAGFNGVPADAAAVALNVTMTETTDGGYVQVIPTGRAELGSSSSVNADRAGQTIANTIIVPLGAGGALTFFSEAGTHLIADVVGYFSPASTVATAGRFVASTATRILDTRNGSKPAPGGVLHVDSSAAPSPVPKGQASAVVVSLTATETTAPGFFQLAPGGGLAPGAASALNSDRAGQTIANLAIVPLADDGTFDLYTQSGSHVIIDVLGWFTNDSAVASTAGRFVPVSPERVYDTRVVSAVSGGPLVGAGKKDPVTGRLEAGSIGSIGFEILGEEASAVMANLTVTETVYAGYFQLGAIGGLVPGASSSLNSEGPGQTIASSAIVPIGTIEKPTHLTGIAVFTQSGGQVVLDISGYFTK